MTDYLQKAADLIDKEPVRESDWTREGIIKRVLATTLEALDKAEAERDALREAAQGVMPVLDGMPMFGHVATERTERLRALIQPEPDPLVAACREALDKGYHETVDLFVADLRASLARHGLAVKEVG